MAIADDRPVVDWLGPYDTVYPPSSGSYADKRGWAGHMLPDENDAAVLLENTHPYTVTHGVATSAVYSLTIGHGATLRSTVAFQVVESTEVDGTLKLAGPFTSSFLYGTGSVVGHGTISSYIGAPETGPGIVPTTLAFKAYGGTLAFDSPSAFLSHIGGLLAGSGTIDFHAGRFVFDAGTRATVANLTVSGAEVSLTQDTRYSGNFSLTGGTLSLVDGQTLEQGSLVLSGQTTLEGGVVLGFGAGNPQDPVLYLRGSTKVAGGTTIQDAVVKNLGHVSAVGDLTLSDSTFTNAVGSVYEFDRDGSILVASGHTGTVVNDGSIVRVGGDSFSEIDGAYVNNGGTQVSTGDLILGGAVTGVGEFAIDNNSRLWFDSAVGHGQQVEFGSVGNGSLVLLDAHDFHGTVGGMNAGDSIDLKGYVAYHDTLKYSQNADGSGGTLTIHTIANQTATIAFSGQFEASGFHTTIDAYNGTSLTYTPPDQGSHAAAFPLHSAV